MPFPEIDPIAFALGPFAVRWYALAYLAGVFLGVIYGSSLLSQRSLWPLHTPPFSGSAFLDFGFWAVLAIVVGGRLGYVLFYNLPYYLQNPLEALQVWQGGMSFHGGMLGLALAMLVFCRTKGANPLSGLDLLAAVSPIGLLLGRIANFINGELYGRETTLPWGVVFPGAGPLPRHPSQLYEGLLEGVVLFFVLRYFTHIRSSLRRPGLTAGVFGIGYAVSRFLVEFVRVPDAHIGYLFGGWLTTGMVITAPVFLAGLLLVALALRQPRRHAY